MSCITEFLSTESYIKMYDYSADAVNRALPGAKTGGPEVTGPSWDKSAAFLTTFLDHVTKGKNYVTGKTGSPLDFIAYHAKGAPKIVDGHVQMNMGTQLRDKTSGIISAVHMVIEKRFSFSENRIIPLNCRLEARSQ